MTKLAERNTPTAVKGYPRRFVSGHQSRKPGRLYEVKDRGYKTPCWLWIRYTNPKGYGMMRVPGESNMKLSHRVFYEREHGPVPEKHFLHHKCEQPTCVNPAHLEPLQSTAHQRHHAHKLTIEDARAIRRTYAEENLTQKQVAERFGVSHALVSFIITEKYWKELSA